jgi:hypothetical protein
MPVHSQIPNVCDTLENVIELIDTAEAELQSVVRDYHLVIEDEDVVKSMLHAALPWFHSMTKDAFMAMVEREIELVEWKQPGCINKQLQ